MCKKNLEIRNEQQTSKEGPTIKPSYKGKRKMRKIYELKPIDRELLRKMLIIDPNISHIAEQLGVARATIRRKIEIFDLEVVREISEEKQKKLLAVQEKKMNYCRLYMQLNGARKIAEIFHTSPEKVKDALREFGIVISESGKWPKIVKHIKTKNFDLPISDKLTGSMIGQLLGDACLRIMKKGDLSYPDLDFGEYTIQIQFLRSLLLMKDFEITEELVKKFNYAIKFVSDYPTAIFRFSQGVIEDWNTEDWVKFNSRLWENEGYTNEVKHSSENTNPFNYFDTIASFQLFDMYALWYPNNKKTVPLNFDMTPDILLYWYIGDGSLSKNSFYIATQSFSEMEVDMLCKLLFSTFGLECHTSLTEDGYILTISLKKDNVTRFFNYLDQADHEALSLAKEIYPWKFDRYLTKPEALANGK